MKRAIIILVGMGCAGAGIGVLFGQAQKFVLPRATVNIEVFGPFGGRIEHPTLHLYTTDRKQDLAKSTQGSKIRDVPYGRYTIVVSSSGGGVGVREISVNSPTLWVVIGVPMPTGHVEWPAGNLTIRGKLSPEPGNRESWWVRAAGMFINTSREAAIQRGGGFEINGLEMGTYVLEVFEGGKLRYAQGLEIDPNRPITDVLITPGTGTIQPP